MTESKRPATREVRAALERILAGDSFAQAGRASAFLRYVVEETLAGRTERVKGHAIAMEVFDRPEDFDAQTDPLVRVEASRLRRRLIEYYSGIGRDEGVVIELARGSYAPRFRYADGFPARGDRASFKNRAAVGISIVVAAVAALPLAAWLLPENSGEAGLEGSTVATSEGAAVPGRGADVFDDINRMPPRLVILPIADFSGDREIEDFAAGLTEELNSAFVAFDIIASVSPNVESSSGIRFNKLRERFRAGYALLGSVRVGDGQLRLILRAIDTGVGTQFWTLTIDEPIDGDLIALQQRIAMRIAQMISSPFGPVFAHEMDRIEKLPSGQLNPFQCLVRFYQYARSFDPALHAESVACMQRVTRLEPRFAQGWSSLATLYLHEHTFGYTTPQQGNRKPLQRALEAARTALDIDGNARAATIALAGIFRAMGDSDGFQRAVDRGLAIDPPHPAALAQMGYLLVLNGDPSGREMVDEAIEATAQVPGWYYVAHAFAALQEDRYEEALSWAGRIDASSWIMAPIAVAASAALANRPEIAAREIERLRQIYPDAEDRAREQLGRWLTNQPLLEKLIDGLILAGLDLS